LIEEDGGEEAAAEVVEQRGGATPADAVPEHVE